MKTVNQKSEKKYQIVTCENTHRGNRLGSILTLTEQNILLDHDDFEVCYALQDRWKTLQNLKVGHSRYFRPVRDNKNTKAIIVRIK